MKRALTSVLMLCMLCQPMTVAAAPQTTENVTTEQTTEQTTTEQTTAKKTTTKAKAVTKSYSLSSETVAIAVSAKKQIAVQGVDGSDTVSWKVEDSSVAAVDNQGNISGKSVGTTKVVAQVGDSQVEGEVVITNPTLSATSGIIAKDETTSVDISGISDESVANVTVNGVKTTATVEDGKLQIQPKKVGIVNVNVEIDGKQSIYTGTVTTRTALKAIAKAVKAKGCKYSQPKRMRKGYYDCSSLIWRIYKPYGINFGQKRVCPTAAVEAKRMKTVKKVVSYKKVSVKKLLPGDVIFYSYTRNGRYRNISHVALYIGNGRIIHAANRRVGVIEANYKATKYIKMIARPTK